MSGESARELKVECPYCGSRRGVLCRERDEAGWYIPMFSHAARVRAAAEKAEKEKANG